MTRIFATLSLVGLLTACAPVQSFSSGGFALTEPAMKMLAKDFVPPLKREVPRSHKLELVSVSPEFTPVLAAELGRAGYAVTVVPRANEKSPARTVRYSLSPFDDQTLWAVLTVDGGFSVSRVYSVTGGQLVAVSPETIRSPASKH